MRHHRLPPKVFQGYALNSHLQKMVFLLLLSSTQHGGPAQAGLQEPPNEGRAAGPSRALQGPPGPSRGVQGFGGPKCGGEVVRLWDLSYSHPEHCKDFGLLGWHLRMYGRSSEGLYTSIPIDSSHCLTQYGCKG